MINYNNLTTTEDIFHINSNFKLQRKIDTIMKQESDIQNIENFKYKCTKIIYYRKLRIGFDIYSDNLVYIVKYDILSVTENSITMMPYKGTVKCKNMNECYEFIIRYMDYHMYAEFCQMYTVSVKKEPLFCILGETASGKDAIVQALMFKYNGKLKEVCSYTNRPKRDKEKDGREHYFVTNEKFKELYNNKRDDIIAYTKIGENGYEYMALGEELDDSNVYIIDPKGLKFLDKKLKNSNKEIISIYISASLSERIKRAKMTRSDFDKEFENRIKNEFDQFSSFLINNEYDYIIKNDSAEDFDNAVKSISDIIDTYIK